MDALARAVHPPDHRSEFRDFRLVSWEEEIEAETGQKMLEGTRSSKGRCETRTQCPDSHDNNQCLPPPHTHTHFSSRVQTSLENRLLGVQWVCLLNVGQPAHSPLSIR